MFPTMSPEGARGAIAWMVAARIIATYDAADARSVVNAAAGVKPNPFADKPKYVPTTTQQAIDAVCTRVRSKR